MNNLWFSFSTSFFAGISTILGTILIFLPIKKEHINEFITFSLAFSISVMIGISVFDLLPDSIIKISEVYSYISIVIIIILFLFSYILVKIINSYLKKYENNLYKLGILSMITLIIHNLPEGILTFLSSYSDPKLGIKLAIAITMHNIPEGIAISVPIYYATKSRKKAFFHSAISGLAEPFGALLAYLFLAKYINEIMIAFILIIVAGLMITLAIEQMFPECLKYHKTKYLNIGLISGVVAVIICLLL